MQNHFVEEKDLKIDQITNSQKQFIVKGGFKSGMFAGKGKTSLAKRLKSPVNLYFDIIFDFDETGKAKIQFTNFSEESFVRVNDEGQFHTEGSMFKMLTPTNGVSDERHTKIKELEANVMKLNTGFGKAMSFIEKGKANVRITVGANGSSVVSNNGIKDDLANLYTDITTEWKILDKAVEDKIAVWVDPAESGYINMYPTLVKKQIAQKEDAEKRLAEKNVLLL